MKTLDDDNEGDEAPATYASPACFMHQLDPISGRLVAGIDEQQRIDVARWRKAERERLIALRLAIPADRRRRFSDQIAQGLGEALGDLSGRIVSGYWAFRGEPDLRAWLEGLDDRGAICALPVVVARHQPLVFRPWRRGEPLQPGVWNIPVPADGGPVIPDIVIAPTVGFDAAGYRLGYGGGFFDRTLASLAQRPRFVGVGYASQAIRTIFPQEHDMAMDFIVTEDGTVTPDPAAP